MRSLQMRSEEVLNQWC